MRQDSFPDVVARLMDERGWSIERLSYAAWNPDIRGTSPATIRKALAGQRSISAAMLEAVARALEVPPETFAEYRLARVRRLFDEDQVGLDAAAENYELLAAVFPHVLELDDRLGEQADTLVAEIVSRTAAARRAEAQEDTPGEAAPPQPATPARAGSRRARRPR